MLAADVYLCAKGQAEDSSGNFFLPMWDFFLEDDEWEARMDDLVPLVVAAQHGDGEAFTHLIQRVSPFAFGLARRRLNDRQTVEDVVQEALLETYACLPRLREPAAFLAWFRRIVIKCVDRELRGAKISVQSVEDLEWQPQAEEHAACRVNDLRVQAALESLPVSLRAVAELHYLGGGSYDTIARTLHLPLSTVKKRLFDARARLRHSCSKRRSWCPNGQIFLPG